jgi:DNA polymerase III subunit epsilon
MNRALETVRSWWRERSGRSAAGAAPSLERWVVVDVESSGLDASRDRLLAIAAMGLRVDWATQRLDAVLGDSFEVVLQQPRQQPGHTDHANILLHGIGAQQQSEGMPPAQALQAFADFVQTAPLLAFHSAFDATMLERHARLHRAGLLNSAWVDLADLCAVTHPGVRARSLDEWMAHVGIRCLARHQASADVLAETELLQHLWPRMRTECRRWKDVEQLAARRRWLGA